MNAATSAACCTALHGAIACNCEAVVERLLSRGDLDPGKEDASSHTPLATAYTIANKAIVQMLIYTVQVNMYYRDRQEHTLLFYAAVAK